MVLRAAQRAIKDKPHCSGMIKVISIFSSFPTGYVSKNIGFIFQWLINTMQDCKNILYTV
jgi:hypothetical protein